MGFLIFGVFMSRFHEHLISEVRHRQFCSFNEIEFVDEIWANKIQTYKVSSALDFARGFDVDGNKYKFEAKISNKTGIISFTTNGDIWHNKLGNTDNIKVFAGVFSCIEELLNKFEIEFLEFNTDKRAPELRDPHKPERGYKATFVEFYDNKKFQQYLKDRFFFVLVDRKESPRIVAWQYKLSEKISKMRLQKSLMEL